MSQLSTGAGDEVGGWTVDEFASLLTVCRSLIYKEVRLRRLRLAKVGGRSIVTRSEGQRYMRMLDAEAAAAAPPDKDAA
jgi:hypothetical protein